MGYRKLSQILALVGVLVFAAGSAWAVPVSYIVPDNVIYWPGYPIAPAYDQLGDSPIVGDMIITVDSGILQQVKIHVENRRLFDSLFLNINWNGNPADYASWDYYVQDNGGGPIFSQVNNFQTSDYILVPASLGGRSGHPSGINPSALTTLPDGVTLSYVGNWLTYDFSNLPVGGPFVIGYSQGCANDVHLAYVPEAMTMFFLGLGLVSLAGLRRRIL